MLTSLTELSLSATVPSQINSPGHVAQQVLLKESRDVGRLLVTGVPGWLTNALLNSLRITPLPGLTAVRSLVQVGQRIAAPMISQTTFREEYFTGDLRDSVGLSIAMQGVDTVLHTAGLLHVRRTCDWYEVNTSGTERLLQAARDAGIKRFVFISSNAAAGRAVSSFELMCEKDPPHPLSHYGRSKWLAERAVNLANGPMETVILRPCMFYGPPVPSRHVEVYRRILTGWMPLVGDGNEPRSLSYIDNVVQGCLLALAHPAANGQTYYVADRPVYTTKQVLDAIALALGATPRLLRFPEFLASSAYRLDMALSKFGLYWQNLHLTGEANWSVGVSCEKARRELGYEPKVELDEGMRRAVSWCRENGQLDRQPGASTR